MDTQDVSREEQLETVDLADLIRVVRERWWVVAAAVLILVAASVAYSVRQSPVYQATAEVVYEPPGLENSFLGNQLLPVSDDYRKLATDARVITSGEIAAQAKATMRTSLTADDLLGMVSASSDEDTNVLRIEARGGNPAETAEVANAFAEGFVSTRTEVVGAALATAKEIVTRQIAAIPREEEVVGYSLGLKAQLEQLEALESMRLADYRILTHATVPGGPVAPQPVRNAILALAVGLVLGLGLAFLLDHLDKRIKDEETAEREFGMPVLASVPAVGGRWGAKHRRKTPVLGSDLAIGFPERTSPLLEPFRTLRSNLEYLNVDHEVRVIMLTSALPQQGKTVTTINLAFSLALSGERVIIIEADLRRPTMHRYLDLTNEVGVTSVLAGHCTFAEAMQLVQTVDFVPYEGGPASRTKLARNVCCVTSGPLPPNPAELAGSQSMEDLLEKAAESADYVLVDTPPLLLVSDALSLAQHVDGVILTALANKTTRDEARQVTSMLERLGARALGVVVAGIKPRRGTYYYKYGYYQQEQPAE